MTADDLSLEAGMAHQQGMGFLFQQERLDCLIPKGLLYGAMPMHRGNFQPAVEELVRAGYWREHEKAYEVVADAEMFRQSLAAQHSKREKDRRAQSKARGKKASTAQSSDDAADDASDESSSPQASKQPSTLRSEETYENDEPWPDVALPGQRVSDENNRPVDQWRVSGEPA